MKNLIINPIGLKGNEINERMIQLMGVTNLNENKKNSSVELTKIGPDGKAYGVIRENHEYFIKISDKTNNLVVEDFDYIGGLQNKKEKSYPSYAKAIKQLNLHFKSLAEAYDYDGEFNIFMDDHLLNEENYATKHITDKDGVKLTDTAKEGSEEDGFGDNVADKKVDKEFEIVKEGFGDDVELTELEQIIDNMIDEDYVDEYNEKVMNNFTKQYGDEKGKNIYYATANKEKRNPEDFSTVDENDLVDVSGFDYEKEKENHFNKNEVDLDDLVPVEPISNEDDDFEDDFEEDLNKIDLDRWNSRGDLGIDGLWEAYNQLKKKV